MSIDKTLMVKLKRIYDEFEKIGDEITVSSPEYERMEIDALVDKGFISKIDVSTLSGWKYIVKPTYEGEKVSRGESNPLRKKVDEFIRRGEEIGKSEIYLYNVESYSSSGHPLYDKWMGEINIFNERHLKKHPLHNSIYIAYFNRQSKASYDDMMGHLRALAADEEFLGPSIDSIEEMIMNNKSLTRMLSEDINRCKKFFNYSSDEDMGRELYDEITGRYDSIIPNFGNGLYQYNAELHFYDPEIDVETLKYNLKKLMNKMETYLAREYPEAIDHFQKDFDIDKNTTISKKLSNKIFIVHGHDNEAKQEMARSLEKAGFEAIILHEQPDGGCTIIEKIEKYSDVSFAVVLYTECDLGRAKESGVDSQRYRARQNVVFEHGYLIGKLGRSHVCALVKGDVETPGDISGVVYTQMDPNGAWKMQLGKNMKDVGLDVDLNKLCM